MANSQFESELHMNAVRSQWDQLIQSILIRLNNPNVQNQKALQTQLCAREGPHQWTPLMLSCVRAPTEVVALLIQSCPSSCAIADRSNSLPLHFVASWRRGGPDGDDLDVQHVIGMLLRISVESLTTKNQWGQTPLHSLFASKVMPSIDVVRVMLGLFDPLLELEEKAKADDDISIPGEEQMSEEEKIEEKQQRQLRNKMLKIHVRKALAMPDASSRLPLHIAAQKGFSEDVLRLLVSLYPEASFVPTINGDLPVHLLHFWAQDLVTGDATDDILSQPLEGSVFAGHIASRMHSNATKNGGDVASPVITRQGLLQAARLTKSKMFKVIGVTQIEALLEPLVMDFISNVKNDSGNSRFSISGREVGTIMGTDAVGVKENGEMKAISERDEEETDTSLFDESFNNEDNFGDNITQSITTSSRTSGGRRVSALARATAIETACRLPGSKPVAHLPIHIATEHGVSKNILAALCELYPEGVATPQLVLLPGSRSGSQATNSSSYANEGDGDDNGKLLKGEDALLPNSRTRNILMTKQKTDSPQLSMYPIELFESGRAGFEAASAAHMQKRHIANPNNFSMTNSTFASTTINFDRVTAILQNFVEASDLLFAYYPEAVPSLCTDDDANVNDKQAVTAYNKMNKNTLNDKGSSVSAARQMRRTIRLYRKDTDRLSRLERLIRSEALDTTTSDLSTTARLVWTWMCRYEIPLDTSVTTTSQRDTYQANIGRIITHLPQGALFKLSYVKQSNVQNGHFRVLSQINENESSSQSGAVLGQAICLPNGRTIQEEADARAANTTFDQMLRLCGEGNNWQYTLTEFLNDCEGLKYSTVCRRTRAAGLRLLPEVKLEETGRTWNIPSSEDLDEKAEFWQSLENVLVTPVCTHTIFVSYYLEVSEAKSSPVQKSYDLPKVTSTFDGRRGGMLVVSENVASEEKKNNKEADKISSITGIDEDRNLWGVEVEAIEQKRIALSNISSSSGHEVRLSFKYKIGKSYTLRVYGPPLGGRVSISNARVRQLVHSSDKYSRTPLHVLLSSRKVRPYPLLSTQVSMLLASNFGSADSVGDVPLHYALKCGVSVEVLEALIAANPSSLVETDKEGRTPLHAAFLLSRDEPPSVGIIKALLSTPGENATKLKDSAVRLPLHIAAERGANEAILRLLVDAYADGCYRQNKDGDLPVHLLVRSGMATTATVELLIRPIMESETICRVPGSRGVDLPLHMAAEYNCCYNVLEKLLSTYRDAASIPRRRPNTDGSAGPPLHALDIFEQWRANITPSATRSKNCNNNVLSQQMRKKDLCYSVSNGGMSSSQSQRESDSAQLLAKMAKLREGSTEMLSSNFSQLISAKEAAQLDMAVADFDLRSDLLFVYNPFLTPASAVGTIPVPYRKETNRIHRLQNLIRREAIQCAEKRKVQNEARLTEMARLAWSFMCTFRDSDDASDHYVESVRAILRGLSTCVVQVLADVPNSLSTPTPNMPIKDSAILRCKRLILSRIHFVGRYLLDDEAFPIHKSESCLVMGATDYGAVECYDNVLSLFRKEEEDPDIDDIASDTMGSIVTSKAKMEDPLSVFFKFASRIGIDEGSARREINWLVTSSDPNDIDNKDGTSESYDKDINDSTREDNKREQKKEINLPAFQEFCNVHGIDKSGTRQVVIKFMMHRTQFLREKISRSKLNLSERGWPVVPIIEDFDVDRGKNSRTLSQSSDLEDESLVVELLQGDWDLSENKDALYSMDIQEKNASIHNFSLYKYALVMPRGDRDLAEILLHEELGIIQIRQYMRQVGMALERLHGQSVIHGNLTMANVVRFGSHLALIDLDSASFSKFRPGSKVDHERMGGSHKFSSGVLPPEMIAKIDVVSDAELLENYEEYWKDALDDASELSLLTPDDIQTITAVVKSLVAKSEAVQNMGSASNSLRITMNEPLAGLEDPHEDWKDILSLALTTISFDDLPHSLVLCESLEEFALVWSRLQANALLWEKVRPRRSVVDDRYAYVVKNFDDTRDLENNINDSIRDDAPDNSLLPYDLLLSSEKIDVWAFGVLLFTLCSGGSLFHIYFNGDLRNASDYEKLYNWNSEMAEKTIWEAIDDPLAHDLLMKLLLPEDERLGSIDLVLQHPFFGPSTGIDAQKIMERYEERQLIEEETVIIKTMTNENKKRFDLSLENNCKIIFEEEKIVVPTCLIVLPYRLTWNVREQALEAPNDNKSIDVAVKIGGILLEINLITAKLSFWLKMKENLTKSDGIQFKGRMKGWLRRARSEDSGIVASEIVSAVGCDKGYKGICIEMLEESDSVSNARAFIKDPMGAATALMKKSTDSLLGCYSIQLAYLVDEFLGVPVLSADSLNGNVVDTEVVYPIKLANGSDQMQTFLLPFMNIAVMTVTALEGMKGLAKLLGIPASSGIPHLWNKAKTGLIHRAEKSSTIVEFAVLQDVLRKQQESFHRQQRNMGRSSPNQSANNRKAVKHVFDYDDSLSLGSDETGVEMKQLEIFFRENDPLRLFAGLRRVWNGKENSPAIWATDNAVASMQSESELANAEEKLANLKKELKEKQKLEHEIENLHRKIDILRQSSSEHPSPADKARTDNKMFQNNIGHTDGTPTTDVSTPNSNQQVQAFTAPTNVLKSSDNTVERKTGPQDYQDAYYKRNNINIIPNTTLSRQYSTSSGTRHHLVRKSSRTKIRNTQRVQDVQKKKLRIKPYFGVC